MRRDWLTLVGMVYLLLIFTALAVGLGREAWWRLLTGRTETWVYVTLPLLPISLWLAWATVGFIGQIWRGEHPDGP